MKRIFTISAALIITASLWAQSPEKISYQAGIRDVNNVLLSTQAIGMQISILQGSITGTAVYVETHTPTTNTNGFITLEIGSGTTISGNFSAINWDNGLYFIKTETDPTGGTNYSITGTNQLLSVPYAFHAKTADSIVGGVTLSETDPIFGSSIANGITAVDTANWNNHQLPTSPTLGDMSYWNGTVWTSIPIGAEDAEFRIVGGVPTWVQVAHVGDFIEGGVVFWVDPLDDTHGLVCALTGQTATWGCDGILITGAIGRDIGTGYQNTIDILAECTTAGTAAYICANLNLNGYNDWFLPSARELGALLGKSSVINAKLIANGGNGLSGNSYWTSTQSSPDIFPLLNDADYALSDGSFDRNRKNLPLQVIAVRAF